MPRSSSSRSIRYGSATNACSGRSGSTTIRPRGCDRATTTGRQYRSIILTANEDQRATAEATRDAYQARLTAAGYKAITTEIVPAGPFYYAEDYHQQYLDKNPNGYCPDHGTGVSCPIGVGVKA